MTLTQYCSQKQVTKLPPGSVVLQEDEYHTYKVFENAPPHAREHSGLIVVVLMFKYEYFVREGETILFTMDDYGNKKSPSVFRLAHPVVL